jgi:hypothetical protein
MIRIASGDLFAVEANGQYYYALILDRIRLFGGNWTFVFHISSSRLMDAGEVLRRPMEGFHAFVDFIWAKRENRLTRLMRGVDTSALRGPGRLKGTHAIKEKANLWFIYDMEFKELKRVSRLTAAEAAYPQYSRIDDTIMVRRVDERWTPDQDPRI